jgi:all-trans-retinol 13,14-reductase
VTPRSDKPWSKRARREGPWDYLVIGSGMGGMTAAALLSKLGKRVLVIEQHYVPGGFTHSFRRPGYSWDVGVHAVGEVTDRSFTGRLLADLTGGRLHWASLGEVYDEFLFPGDFRIDFPDSPAQFRDNLLRAFPQEGRAVDAYLGMVRDVAGAMKAYYLSRTLPPRLGPFIDGLLARKAQRFLEMRTAGVLSELTRDPKLCTIFAAQWGYYGSVPSRSSFAIQALVVKHFQWGGFYPVGGSQRIARELLTTVAEGGGWTRIATDVKRIVLERGRAAGVELVSGERITAGRVISAAGVGTTVRRLLPEHAQSAPWVREVRALAAAPAHVCLYLGFRGDIRRAGAGAANKWFYSTWSTEDDAWRVDPSSGALGQAPVLYCSFPSLKDPAHDPGPEERHTGEVVTFVPWEIFAPWRDKPWKKRGPDYEAFKERLSQSLLDQFLAHMPELAPLVDYAELSTPLSTDNFCRPLHGSIYGLEPTPDRFRNRWLRPRSPIPQLFFAGSEVASVGVIGAMMGGVMAAVSAEPLGALHHLRRVT